MPDPQAEEVLTRFARDQRTGKPIRAIEGMKECLSKARDEGNKIVLVSSGPQTNFALFLSVYPELIDAVEEIVFMGGGVGMGNRSAAAGTPVLCMQFTPNLIC